MSDSTPGSPDRGPAVFAVTTATLCLATLFVAARLVTRVGIVRRTRACDHMMTLAWLIAVFLSTSVILAAKRGLGRHERDIDPDKRSGLRRCEYVFSVLYNPVLMATKTSILLFYLRLSKQTQRTLRLASWATMGVVNVAGTVLTFINIFQCQPVRAAWDITVQRQRCIPLLTEFICSAPVNVVTDLAILALPIPVLTSMRLPPRQKTILVATFALGIFVTVVDVIRIYYLQQAIDRAPTARYGQSDDFSWNASLALMWSAVEVNVGIICACIPTLKPLFIRILPVMLVDGRGAQGSSSTLVGGSSGRKASIPAPLLLPTPPTSAESISPGSDNLNNSNEADDDEISIRDFLSNAVPAPVPPPRPYHQHPSMTTITTTIRRGPRQLTSRTTRSKRNLQFISLPATSKSLLTLSAKESLLYSAMVSSTLFFLWGFSYGLLNSINNAAAAVTGMSEAQTLGLTAVYFGGGYLAGPGAVFGKDRPSSKRRGWRIERRRSGLDVSSVGWFKGTFIAGVLVYGIGTIMIWPGAVVGAYGGFVASSFVIGLGLAVLETAANPFLVLCGPPSYADARLLLAQGVQAVGSVLSGVLADRVFFEGLLLHENSGGGGSTTTLINVQWTYLAITLLAALLALFFYYIPLPEASDADLAEAAARLPVDSKQRSVGGIPLRTWALALAVFSQWCYVSAQETMSLFSEHLLTSFASEDPMTGPSSTTTTTAASTHQHHHFLNLTLSLPNTLLLSHALFAFSRFLAGSISLLSAKTKLTNKSHHPISLLLLRLLPTPRTLLTLSITLSTTSALTLVLLLLLSPSSKSNSTNMNTNPHLTSIPPLLLFPFFSAPIWPLLFSLGLRGQGSNTKSAAAWITAGGCGPGAWVFVSYAIIHHHPSQNNVQVGMVVVFVVVSVLTAVAGVFPAFLGVVKPARKLVDAYTSVSVSEGGNIEGGTREEGSDVEGRVGRKDGGEGGLLAQRLRPSRPGGVRSLSGYLNSNWTTASSDQQEAQLPQRAPWENEVLDTSMLRDRA
ncbi:hypothetical protein N657DRAFT_623734 [Parathielavia appendiculata]|uniref:Rhodopsin domain-containing protein n=1 Tax=Parathielavia appendiculata TaxID=2587402 RepID=A0AAN6TVC7_9PEZI|nr:hypothetical protein N657DRAFT_623734 [Parathielavia appendiculata]